MYNEKVEKLIDAALADGELTEKEKQILFKNAEAAGIDLDEFEMVLDAKLYEKQKAMNVEKVESHASAPKSDKYGDVKKCPSCGAMIESFTTRCPDCGYEFRNIGVVSSFLALTKKLEDFDSHNNGNIIIDQLFGGELRRIQQKKQIIANFPIPTTKEDILEFLTMGVPLAQTRGGFFSRKSMGSENYEHNQLASAWKSKLEQVMMKVRLAMKDDKVIMAEIEKYAKELKIKL